MSRFQGAQERWRQKCPRGAEGDERIAGFQVMAERVCGTKERISQAAGDGVAVDARGIVVGGAEERLALPGVEGFAVDLEGAADGGIGVAGEEASEGVALASGEAGGGWAAGFSKCICWSGVFWGVLGWEVGEVLKR